MRDDQLRSGFLNHDYLLTFCVADAERRGRLVDLCRGPWQGDEVVEGTWEISNDLSPDEMETILNDILAEGDRAAYYYLTPPLESGMPGVPPGKRIFRVVIG